MLTRLSVSSRLWTTTTTTTTTHSLLARLLNYFSALEKWTRVKTLLPRKRAAKGELVKTASPLTIPTFFLGGNLQALQRRRGFICTETDSRWLLDCDSAAVPLLSSLSCGAACWEFIKLLNSHSVSPRPKQKKITFLINKWWNSFAFLQLRKQKKTMSFPAAVPPSGSALKSSGNKKISK